MVGLMAYSIGRRHGRSESLEESIVTDSNDNLGTSARHEDSDAEGFY